MDFKINKMMVSALIAQRLCRHGWRPAAGAALATKTFQTAVGRRNAFVYLEDYGNESANYLLQGDYMSEGRNQLESHFVLLPKEASPDTIHEISTQFAVGAESVISNTYAMKLA